MTADYSFVGSKEIGFSESDAQVVTMTKRKRRRERLMTVGALICIFLFLLVLVLKIVFALHPDFRAICGGAIRPSFSISGNTFMKDGRPFQYISGSIHYSRVPHQYWRDRLRKMRAAGLDAIQTYVPWNFHQPLPGQSNWKEDRDLVNFIEIAQEEGLLVILRAGPYICAEWDFGGLPAWLLQMNASMAVRSSDPLYLKYVDAWMGELLSKMEQLLYQNGGPIIMVQLENEYGTYYECDKKYMSHLYDLGRKILGPEIILFTTDSNSEEDLRCGVLDRRFFATIDFGVSFAANPASTFSILRKFQPTGPLVNSEYYVGWFDTWGGAHANVAVEPIVRGLQAVYKYNASINMYMFSGGTTFAYWNSAEAPPFEPQVTSYDFDAPLSEAGDMTWKYQRLKEVIHKLKGKPLLNTTNLVNASVLEYGKLSMKPLCHFTSLLPKYPKSSSAGQPLQSMESMGVYQGYAVYSTFIGLNSGKYKLVLPKVRDRAYVFTSDINYNVVKFHGVVTRDSGNTSVTITAARSDAAFLHILVENGGHVNFNKLMHGDVKGLFGNVSLDGRIISHWHFYDLELNKDPPRLYRCNTTSKPTQGMFFSQIINLNNVGDTYLLPIGFRKGQAMLNFNKERNFNNIGRYWPVKGPQRTLFVPSTFLHRGVNVLTLFEVEGIDGSCPGSCFASFVKEPKLGRVRLMQPER